MQVSLFGQEQIISVSRLLGTIKMRLQLKDLVLVLSIHQESIQMIIISIKVNDWTVVSIPWLAFFLTGIRKSTKVINNLWISMGTSLLDFIQKACLQRFFNGKFQREKTFQEKDFIWQKIGQQLQVSQPRLVYVHRDHNWMRMVKISSIFVLLYFDQDGNWVPSVFNQLHFQIEVLTQVVAVDNDKQASSECYQAQKIVALKARSSMAENLFWFRVWIKLDK